MYENGWIYCGSIDTGKLEKSLNALYFRYEPESASLQSKSIENNCFFALSLYSCNLIRFHNVNKPLVEVLIDPMYGIFNLWQSGLYSYFILH